MMWTWFNAPWPCGRQTAEGWAHIPGHPACLYVWGNQRIFRDYYISGRHRGSPVSS